MPRFDQKPETTLKLQPTPSDSSPSSVERLNLLGPLILGGIHPNHTTSTSVFSNPSHHLPAYFYSGMLSHGFVGCMQDVEINGQLVNLTHHIRREAVLGVAAASAALTATSDSAATASDGGHFAPVCAPMPNQCEIGHCLNDGVCNEGWNRFVCDCSATGFNGPICNQRKLINNFWNFSIVIIN